jgi:hypothetical protein
MSTCLRTLFVALALISSASAVSARPLDDNTALSASDGFDSTQDGGGKAYWDMTRKDGN